MTLSRLLTVLSAAALLLAGPARAVPLDADSDSPRRALRPAATETRAAEPADQDYADAIKKLAANDTAGAELAFKRALEKKPDHANALLGLAEIAFKNNRADQADNLIRRAIIAAPENAHARASLGRLLAMQNKYEEAEGELKKATYLDPKMIRPRMDLADIYATALRKPKDALAQYREVLAINPNHAGAQYASGMMQMRLGDQAKARAALETAARMEPGNPLPPLALARLSLERKELDGAMAFLGQALKIQPNLADALELRGDVQQARNRPDLALADYDAATKAQSTQVSARFKQGSLLQRLGRNDEAAQAYQAALKVNPRLAPAYNNLAWMAAESGRNLEQAEKWGGKAVELEPKIADFHDTLAWVYRARGKLKEAEESLQRATAMKPVPVSAFYHLGMVREEMGKTKEAVALYQKTLALDKAHQGASQALRRLGGR